MRRLLALICILEQLIEWRHIAIRELSLCCSALCWWLLTLLRETSGRILTGDKSLRFSGVEKRSNIGNRFIRRRRLYWGGGRFRAEGYRLIGITGRRRTLFLDG